MRNIAIIVALALLHPILKKIVNTILQMLGRFASESLYLLFAFVYFTIFPSEQEEYLEDELWRL